MVGELLPLIPWGGGRSDEPVRFIGFGVFSCSQMPLGVITRFRRDEESENNVLNISGYAVVQHFW